MNERSRSTSVQVLVAIWLAGCGPAPPVGAPPLRVEYTGCERIFDGTACGLLPGASLKLWVAVPAGTEVRLGADGRPLESSVVPVQGGLRFEIEPPEDAAEVTVATATAAVWKLAIDRRPQPGWWLRALELWREDPEPAAAVIEEQIDSPSPVDRCTALGMLGNIRYKGGDDAGAVDYLRAAVEVCRDAGGVLAEIRNAGTLIYILRSQGRFQEARAVLDSLQPPAGAPAETAIWIAYSRGLLAEQIGDSRSTLRHLSDAAERAERVGHRDQRDCEELLAKHLQGLGRTRDAAEIYMRLRDAGDLSDCDRARLLTNYAWSLLLVLEADGEPSEDPAPLLEQALEVFSNPKASCASQADRRSNVLLNLALAHIHRGRLRPARAALTASSEPGEEPLLQRLWRLEIEGRLLLAEGELATALERYHRLGTEGVTVPEARWRAAVGRGRIWAAAGDRAAALTALAEAEVQLDEESLQVPIHQGRETFVAQREAGTRLYLRLLLDDGAVARAFAVARRARARVLRGLWRGDRLTQLEPEEQKRWDQAIFEYAALRDDIVADDDWDLPAAELEQRRTRRRETEARLRAILDRAFAVLDAGRGGTPAPDRSRPPADGELILAYHPLDDGWVGFAADSEGVRARRLGDPQTATTDPVALAGRVLQPFAERIAPARRLRILAYGPLRRIDFHALPFAGDVLLAGRKVVYGLDLALPTADARRGRLVALVVGDPRGDLPQAAAEAERVRRILAEGGAWDVRLLTGGGAGAEAVRRELATTDLFHYAGHGAFAGRGGWESALDLASGSQLTLSDVLTLERVPRWVVLSSCEAARSAFDAPAESVAMAHAFLAAGSRQVIAATRPVGDRDTAELIAAIYHRWDGSADLATLLWQAQLDRRADDPDTDWAAFRVLEP